MRLFVMFDLPVDTSRERRAYRQFVKYLTNEGYVRIQYSIYSKLILNRSTLLHQMNKLKREVPLNGTVQTLTVTEKQFSDMTYLVGEAPQGMIGLRTDRVIEL
ncbi:CRISPR-associated endonuclease Cas2 [Macrococcus brunensis]|uniref:CRISPR-associated endoribonuclease Cas2 n=1 Tax=Macrococcus brunensis TaxID=198483 RepID=A0A4R6BEN8_9STAP|nr:CRISPR-associated endonuclease Cas2 [Macrococcus brunensis]TDL98239.1 CRISPR-associated endonuclease Cas2 [Macrococcus brunensis]